MTARLSEIAALHNIGQNAIARSQCLELIEASPNDADAYHLLALIEHRLGANAAAAAAAQRAVDLAPDRAAYWNTLGVVLIRANRFQEAIDAFARAHALEPQNPSTIANLGNALMDAGRLEEALAAFDEATAQAPRDYGFAISRATVLGALDDVEAALAEFSRAVQLQQRPLEGLIGCADMLRRLHREVEGIEVLDRALALDPANPIALQNSAAMLHNKGELGAAYDRFVQLWKLTGARPQYAEIADYALGMAVSCARSMCAWEEICAMEAELWQRIRCGRARVVPTLSFAVFDDTEIQAICAQRYFRHDVPVDPPRQRLVVREAKRLRLGYISADFREHPTARLIAGLIEDHDRDRFEVCAFSNGPDDGSALRARMVRAFDSFTEIAGLDDAAAATLITESGIDILIDLSGPMTGGRPGVVARKPAPVIVHFIGNPGPPGADAVDYFIADEITVLASEREKFGCAVVRLPPSVMPVDPRADIAAQGSGASDDYGLPAGKFVFFGLCQSIKLSPEGFDAWMRILVRAPASVLWLLEDNRFLRSRLEHEAQRRGVEPTRLVFAPRVPHRDHMARHRAADLVLDTWPCGAHTTAVEALSWGVPMITKSGQTYASRIGASVLHAAGVPELIAHSSEAYEDLAFEVASSPALHTKLKVKLQASLRQSTLFNSELHRQRLEAAYEEIWRRFRSGLAVQSFDVRLD